MSNNITFSLDNALDDLSMNIYNLKNSYQTNDISNEIVDLGNKIHILNDKVEEVLNIYNMIDDLKQKLNIN